MKELFSALVKAQSEIKIALKDSKNPHFKSTYADLASVWDACRDALHKNGLAVIQLSKVHESGVPVLVTHLIHTSGQSIAGEYPLLCKDPNDPQRLLSALTYARRGCLAAAIGVIADDDDGNTAAGHTSAPAKPVSQVAANVAKVAAAAPAQAVGDILGGHGKSMTDLEDAVGGKQATWTDSQKVKARTVIANLKAGKPWAEAIK